MYENIVPTRDVLLLLVLNLSLILERLISVLWAVDSQQFRFILRKQTKFVYSGVLYRLLHASDYFIALPSLNRSLYVGHMQIGRDLFSSKNSWNTFRAFLSLRVVIGKDLATTFTQNFGEFAENDRNIWTKVIHLSGSNNIISSGPWSWQNVRGGKSKLKGGGAKWTFPAV